jgi:hypothetical protein
MIMLPFTVRRIRQQGDESAQLQRDMNRTLHALLQEIERTNEILCRTNEILCAVHGVREE